MADSFSLIVLVFFSWDATTLELQSTWHRQSTHEESYDLDELRLGQTTVVQHCPWSYDSGAALSIASTPTPAPPPYDSAAAAGGGTLC